MYTGKGSSKAVNIKKDVIKIPGWSNCYLISSKKTILIDCGSPYDDIKDTLESLSKKIDICIFTHLHYDHIANWSKIRCKSFFASRQEIEDFRQMPEGTVLDQGIAGSFRKCRVFPAEELQESLRDLEIISTPGHTRGSICIMYEDVLFTGDTLFREGVFGRTDLPTSTPMQMQRSLDKIRKIGYKHLCPGHNY